MLSLRARKALSILKIDDSEALARKTEDEILCVKNVGLTTLRELRRFLEGKGRRFRKPNA